MLRLDLFGKLSRGPLDPPSPLTWRVFLLIFAAMSSQERLAQEIKAAMLAKDADRLSALRMLKSAVGYTQIEKKTENLSEPDFIAVVQREVKKRRDSIEQFEKGGRAELAWATAPPGHSIRPAWRAAVSAARAVVHGRRSMSCQTACLSETAAVGSLCCAFRLWAQS